MNRGVAQGVAHMVWDHGVAGSNPVAPSFAPVAQLDRATDF